MEKSKHAGKEYRIIKGPYVDKTIVIEDTWENIAGCSHVLSAMRGNPAANNFISRLTVFDVQGEVLYGKIGPYGYLIHEGEIVDMGTPKE